LAKGKVTYKNAWATTHLITDDNVTGIARGAPIENCWMDAYLGYFRLNSSI